MELGGWKSLRMVERYAHLSPHHLADAVERLAGSVDPAEKFLRFSLQSKSRNALTLCLLAMSAVGDADSPET